MVTGLEIFRNYFKDFTKDYIVIGGVACDLALRQDGNTFRITRDFDIVVISENLKEGFGLRLKEFIRDGGYIVQLRKSVDKPTFFRFVNPQNGEYPFQIELASNKPAVDWISNFVPLNVGDAKSSLSAIVFESNYYEFIRQNTTVINGVSTVPLHVLVPLKGLALLKLSELESPTEKNRNDIIKHMDDILYIANVLPTGVTFSLPENIAADLRKAVNLMDAENLSDYQESMLAIVKKYYLL